MAASGPMALATSFAPCAKLSNAAEKINGTVKRVLIDSFVFSSKAAFLRIIGVVMNQLTTAITNAMPIACHALKE